MAEFTAFRLDKKDGGVAEVVLNRPTKLNSMNITFFEELGKMFKLIDEDASIKVAILWAEGRIFTTGLDLKEAPTAIFGAPETDSKAMQNLHLYRHIKSWQGSLEQIRVCKKPVIAAVHGACIGGGIDLITACDIRLCTSDATFCVGETKLAMAADLGTLQRLPKLIGRGFAREMAFTGDNVNSQKALRFHLVNEIFEDKQKLLEGARDLARKIAVNSPLAVQATKQVLNYAEEHTIADGLEQIALFNSAFLLSDDLQEALYSFIEKRKPVFKNNL